MLNRMKFYLLLPRSNMGKIQSWAGIATNAGTAVTSLEGAKQMATICKSKRLAVVAGDDLLQLVSRPTIDSKWKRNQRLVRGVAKAIKDNEQLWNIGTMKQKGI